MPSPKQPGPNANQRDNDVHKGAVEEESAPPGQANEHNLNSQLGHRDQDEMLKDSDSDLPG